MQHVAPHKDACWHEALRMPFYQACQCIRRLMSMVSSAGRTCKFEVGGDELYLHEEGVRLLFVMFRVEVCPTRASAVGVSYGAFFWQGHCQSGFCCRRRKACNLQTTSTCCRKQGKIRA